MTKICIILAPLALAAAALIAGLHTESALAREVPTSLMRDEKAVELTPLVHEPEPPSSGWRRSCWIGYDPSVAGDASLIR